MSITAGICDTNDVQLGNLVLNSIDELGGKWLVTDIDGWWTLPEADIPDPPRGWDDGSYETIGRYQARIITLSGVYIPASASHVPAARALILANSNLVRQSTYFMTHEADYTRGSRVLLSGAPLVATTNISGRTDFSIGLKAPDPVKYAFAGRTPPGYYTSTVSGVGGTTITNEGNYMCAPTLLVQGPTYGPINLVNTTSGDVVEVRLPIAGGETLEINCRDRSVTRNGVRNQRNYLQWDTDWMELLPGPNVVQVVNAGGGTAPASTLTVQWRHSWIG